MNSLLNLVLVILEFYTILKGLLNPGHHLEAELLLQRLYVLLRQTGVKCSGAVSASDKASLNPLMCC